MTTWGQFQQIQFVDGQSLNTGNVTEGLADTLFDKAKVDSISCRLKMLESLQFEMGNTHFVLVVNYQWTTALNATTVTHFTTTSTETLRLVDLQKTKVKLKIVIINRFRIYREKSSISLSKICSINLHPKKRIEYIKRNAY